MGTQELRNYFSSYAAVKKGKHSYGPDGHRGMSLLIFDESAIGYVEAERLHRKFVDQKIDRAAWDRFSHVSDQSRGLRQLYGYMAMKDDIVEFNRHYQGGSRLKFEMKSYQEKVVNDLRQMKENYERLIMLEKKVAKDDMDESCDGEEESFEDDKD